jgi:hypothetical protein
MQTSRMPHAVQIGVTITTVCIAAILAANTKGDLTLPAVVVSILSVLQLAFGLLSDSWSTVTANKMALSGPRGPGNLGFARISLLHATAAVGALLFGVGATCTPAQIEQAVVQVVVDACQEAPLLLPPGTVAGWVALVCSVIDPKTGLPKVGGQTVLMPASQWSSMKLEYLKTHQHLPGGMSAP